MGIKLEVDFDSFDEAVRIELQVGIKSLLDPANDPNESPRNILDTVDGFLIVLDYYSKPTQFKDFMASIQSDYNRLVNKAYPPYPMGDMDIKVLKVRDLPDGSANVEYEFTEKMKEFLMGVGLTKILEDAVEETLKEAKSNETPGWEYYD